MWMPQAIFSGLFLEASISNGFGLSRSWRPNVDKRPYSIYNPKGEETAYFTFSPPGESISYSYYLWNPDSSLVWYWGG